MHILVVDDDPLAAEMIAAIIEGMDMTPLIADNGMDALEKLEATPDIRLIISDMNMPLLSGLELFELLRQQHNQCPFILLTGDDPTPLHQQQPAITACLLKDFSLDETLPDIIHQALNATGTP